MTLLYRWRFLLISGLLALQACSTAPRPASPVIGSVGRQAPVITADFESGSLGRVTPPSTADDAWRISLRDDNNDASLPASFRTWFYFQVDNLQPGSPLRLTLTGFGSRYPVVPVYSLDNRTWQAFAEEDLSWQACSTYTLARCELQITRRFDTDRVWIARTYPYTTSHLQTFFARIAGNPHARREVLGTSPGGRPIEMLTIGQGAAAAPQEALAAGERPTTVWVNARTHPGETGPSFVVEGLVDRLLADDELGQALRRRHVFKIVPMHNVDGVVAGNYRTNLASANLENSWHFDPEGRAQPDAPQPPPENQLLMQQALLPMLRDGGRVELALNLHGSNAAADAPYFFLPHFGNDPTEFDESERLLWEKQQHFIALVGNRFHGPIGVENEDGGRGFLRHAFPETWWWNSQGPQVNAITLETTYGSAGLDHYATEDDLRGLGEALARAIDDLGSSKAACAYITAPLPAFCVDVPQQTPAPVYLEGQD